MVLEAERILVIDVDADNVALPSDGSAKVVRLEVAISLPRLCLEYLVAALALILLPSSVGQHAVTMQLLFDEDESVNRQRRENHHGHVGKVATCQNNAKVSNLCGHHLVFQAVETEKRLLLDVVQAFATLVDGLLSEPNKEGHHHQTHDAEDKDAKNGHEITEQICLV